MRRLMRAGAAAALVAGLIPVQTAVADSPSSPSYKQSKQCIGAVPAVPSVSDGVSWAQQQLLYTDLWQYSRGRGVKVAVVDTGVNPGKAFGRRLKGIGDLVHPTKGSSPGLSDCDGHGTLVAGLIGGRTDAASGFSGVAPESTVLSLRQNSLAFEPSDSSKASGQDASAGTEATLARAVNMAVKAGADVINISAAQCGSAQDATAPALASAIRGAVNRDVVVVVAAGNLGSTDACKTQNTPNSALATRASPADVPAALTVGSVNKTGDPSEFSVAGPWVDVAAPGEQIVSVNPHPASGGEVNKVISTQGYSTIQGTSFSAPYVAGVAALIRGRYPGLSAREVVRRIVLTSGPAAGNGGRSYAEGAGPIDPLRALTAVIPGESHAELPRQQAVEAVDAPNRTPPEHGRQMALVGSALAGGVMALVGLTLMVRRHRAQAGSAGDAPRRSR